MVFISRITTVYLIIDGESSMSDLFVGEILVLILLIPVLARPFVLKLRYMEGLTLLPVTAVVVAVFVVLAEGLSLTLFPVLAFAVLMFLVTLPRMVQYTRGLPTDFFGPGAILGCVLLSIVYTGVVCVSILYMPEPYSETEKMFKKESEFRYEGNGLFATYSLWSPPEADQWNRNIVLFLHDASTAPESRPIAASLLSSEGFYVVEASFTGNCGYTSILHKTMNGRRIAGSLLRVFGQSELVFRNENLEAIQIMELNRMLSFCTEKFGSTSSIYICAEGSANKAALQAYSSNPGVFKGVVCIAGSTEFETLSAKVPDPCVPTSVLGSLPPEAYASGRLFLTAPDSHLFGLGEIGSTDVLQAILLGGFRDEGHRTAELVGRKILTWIQKRSENDSSRP